MSGALFLFNALIPLHREAALPRVGRDILAADAGDLDIVAFLDHGEQGDEFVRVALHFQRYAAIVLVLHPAGQVEGLRGVPRPVAETY